VVTTNPQQNILLSSQDCDDILSFTHPDYQVLCYTRRSITKKTMNEDALLVAPLQDGGLLLAIADGMGGQRGGAVASHIVTEKLHKAVQGLGDKEITTRAAILDAIERANRDILALCTGAGTTLVLAELQQSNIHPIHIGDSEILVTGQRGKPKFRTISHSPVGYMLEAGLIDSKAALYHQDRHIISNYVGTENMHIDIGSGVTLAQYDTMLIGSDGVFDNLTEDRLIEIIRKGPLAKAAERLLAECLASMSDNSPGHYGKPDDVSFILVRRA